MQITLNGTPTETNATDILALLKELGISDKPVVVELNKAALLPAEHQTAQLSAGDLVEVITLAAGG